MRPPTFKLIENPTVKDLRGDRRYLLQTGNRYDTARFSLHGEYIRVWWDCGGFTSIRTDSLWDYVYEIDDGCPCWDIECEVLMDDPDDPSDVPRRVVVETVRKRVWAESAPKFDDPYRNLLSVDPVTTPHL